MREQFRQARRLEWVSSLAATEHPMSAAARSILVYSIYVLGLGATLLLIPNVPLSIVGLPTTTEVWIHVTGMTVIFLGIIYFLAARNESRTTFVASVPIRFSVPVFFAVF